MWARLPCVSDGGVPSVLLATVSLDMYIREQKAEKDNCSVCLS